MHVLHPATQHADIRPPQPAWVPSQIPAERAIRRRMWRLRYYLRHIARDRIKACGFALTSSAGGVGVAIKPEGGAFFRGLQTCGSVWECPPCQMTIKAKRADEIRRVIEKHGHARAAMLSLTIRHGRDDDLARMRKDFANAWRGFTRGAAWKRFCERHKVIGWVRSLEITHSNANGWHPHIHVLLLFADELPALEVYKVDGVTRWIPSDVGWVIERWQAMVCRYIGAEHEPDDDHGAVLSPCFSADYISKLGLEISDPGAKKGRRGGRTPLQIASDFADASAAVKKGGSSLRRQKARDGWLWTSYCEAMRGARQLTWSRGLKAKFGIVDRTDADVAQEEEPACDDQAITVGVIDSKAWDTIRCRRVGTCSAAYYVLRAAEIGGGPGLRKAVAEIVSGRCGVLGG